MSCWAGTHMSSPAAAGELLCWAHLRSNQQSDTSHRYVLTLSMAAGNRTHEQGEKQIQQLLEAGITTFISLQVRPLSLSCSPYHMRHGRADSGGGMGLCSGGSGYFVVSI